MSRDPSSGPVAPIVSSFLPRRRFIKGGLVGAASIAFGALSARPAQADGRSRGKKDPAGGYGPLSPKMDLATGLPLLALPEGFEYMSYGWTGQTMTDGRPTPTDHDGMAVVAKRGRLIALVRNHELSTNEGPQCYVEGGMYNPAEFGGCTNLYFDLQDGIFVGSYVSQGGTIRNCAGGLTPWKSWITCEETFHAWGSRADGFNHGYIFDVPGFGISDGQPIRAAGPLLPRGGRGGSRHRHRVRDRRRRLERLLQIRPPRAPAATRVAAAARIDCADGGELYAMVIDGVTRKDLRGGFAEGRDVLA